ncbi:hypothetical protein N0V82_002100 [Gnomoniopsis sp. IMI 355080]|nr:hypothetical protein N0V82_002100 [Gnomoniopsis sp. IMI 355080]
MGDFRDIMRVMGSRIGGVSYDPARDIPSLANQVILITGAAGDLGRVTATQLARHGRPHRIYVADLPPRDDAVKKELVDRITKEAYEDATPEDGNKTEIRFLDLDLGSFESIQRCATEFLAQEQRLDILMLNAGIMRVATGLTKEGYECHFGINYVGHSLLLKLLTPVVLRTAEISSGRPRVVIVSSEGWAMAPKGGILFDKVKTKCEDLSYTKRYGQSKLALIHLTKEVAQRHSQIDVVVLHPGRVETGLGLNLIKDVPLMRLLSPVASFLSVSPVEGAKNHLWTATSPDVVSGKYYEPIGVPDKEGNIAKDVELRKKLWTWTEAELQGLDVKEEHNQVAN